MRLHGTGRHRVRISANDGDADGLTVVAAPWGEGGDANR